MSTVCDQRRIYHLYFEMRGTARSAHSSAAMARAKAHRPFDRPTGLPDGLLERSCVAGLPRPI